MFRRIVNFHTGLGGSIDPIGTSRIPTNPLLSSFRYIERTFQNSSPVLSEEDTKTLEEYQFLTYSSRVQTWQRLGILCLGFLLFSVSSLSAAEVRIQHHNLEISLNPEQHTLAAQDTLQLNIAKSKSPLIRLTLNPSLTIDQIRVQDQEVSFQEVPLREEQPSSEESAVKESWDRTIEIELPKFTSGMKNIDLTVVYQGKIFDPPRARPGLRFVRPDQTAGHIGQEGVYLTSETRWYPDVSGSLATFHLLVTTPEGWETVTQGKDVSRKVNDGQTITEWDIKTNTDALTLVANHFVRNQRDWNGIELSTYLLPENAHLAKVYLDATAKYMTLYTDLLGPYPFRKFSVVENFFPSGIGLPSYTLLGSHVIRRGYIQPYSLGHEIVHSWFGNSVFNDFDKGNWVEGLTTYLANYYYEELHEPIEKVVKHRRKMVIEYSLYAVPSHDYPLIRFHHKETRVDNAIGYQKSAMIFHMLRHEIGDQAFFSGIRTLVKKWSGAYADWGTLERLFGTMAGRDLRWFFHQWVERSGAPVLNILETGVQEEAPGSSGQYVVHMKIVQQDPPYRLRFPVVIDLADGTIYKTDISVEAPTQTVRVPVPAKPAHLAMDPEYETFRRLKRDQIPPMLNLWTTDRNRVLVLHKESSEGERASFQPILHRIRSERSRIEERTVNHIEFGEESLLSLVGPAGKELALKGMEGCGNTAKLEHNRVIIQNQIFEGPDVAVLISCPNPIDPTHVVTIFYASSPQAAAKVARLLFFYGWDSYLVFKGGKVIARGNFEPPSHNLEVRFNGA